MESEKLTILDLLISIESRLTEMENRIAEVEAKAHVQVKGADLEANVAKLFRDMSERRRQERETKTPTCQWAGRPRDALFC